MSANPTPSETPPTAPDEEESSLLSRIAENPRPAVRWGAVLLVLLVIEFGAALSATLLFAKAGVVAVTALIEVVLNQFAGSVGGFIEGLRNLVLDFQYGSSSFFAGLRNSAENIPTLLDRDLISNQGHRTGNGTWKGTFLGLEPAVAWALRAGLVYLYSFGFVYWVVRGYFVFREHYRYADWSPRDDVINRLRTHRWGQFGMAVVFVFITMALFAPTLGPTTVEQNVYSTYDYETKFYDDRVDRVRSIPVGRANLYSASKGQGNQHVGPMMYDEFDRFHPFGTMKPGWDLFTYMVAGSRISLAVGLIAIGLGGFIAVAMALLSAYYKGLVDIAAIMASDSIMSIPQFLLLILISVAFQGHWLNKPLNGGLLIALIFGLTGWPGLWRAVRGPALQVSEEEWIDAAKSFGQRSTVTMRKHMLPYILGYLLVYGSMTLGGVVISTSALSFLGNGLGVAPPTPEWGRAINLGQQLVNTQSTHTSLIPGIMIVFVVTGFNAFGDGIRDAIDPQSSGSEGGAQAAAAGGGG